MTEHQRVLAVLERGLLQARNHVAQVQGMCNMEETSAESAARSPLEELERLASPALKLFHLQNQVVKFERALARLEEGTYGQCARCDQPIDQERLTIDPAAPYCIRCLPGMSLIDQTNLQMGP